MTKTRSIAAAAASILATAALASPALAKAPSHWSKAQCQSWQSSFHKRNPHANATRKVKANKVLRANGCRQRV